MSVYSSLRFPNSHSPPERDYHFDVTEQVPGCILNGSSAHDVDGKTRVIVDVAFRPLATKHTNQWDVRELRGCSGRPTFWTTDEFAICDLRSSGLECLDGHTDLTPLRVEWPISDSRDNYETARRHHTQALVARSLSAF